MSHPAHVGSSLLPLFFPALIEARPPPPRSCEGRVSDLSSPTKGHLSASGILYPEDSNDMCQALLHLFAPFKICLDPFDNKESMSEYARSPQAKKKSPFSPKFTPEANSGFAFSICRYVTLIVKSEETPSLLSLGRYARIVCLVVCIYIQL